MQVKLLIRSSFLLLALVVAGLPFLQSGYVFYRKASVAERAQKEKHFFISIPADQKGWNHDEIDMDGHRYDIVNSRKAGNVFILEVIEDEKEGNVLVSLSGNPNSKQKAQWKKITVPDWTCGLFKIELTGDPDFILLNRQFCSACTKVDISSISPPPEMGC